MTGRTHSFKVHFFATQVVNFRLVAESLYISMVHSLPPPHPLYKVSFALESL